MPVSKEQIRQIISENNISNVDDVYSLLKDSFKDILQELLEAELDTSLGYKKIRKAEWIFPIKEMVTLQKVLRVSMENFRLTYQETVMVSLSQS